MNEMSETIAEVLRLDAEAHPGEWVYFPKPKYREHHVGIPANDGWKVALFPDGCPTGEEDAALIAYYRTAAPALAREVRQAQTGHDCALVAAYESGLRAGQEAMRYRCASHVADNADGACNCGGTILCQPDCARVRLLDLVVAIRALEVER